jgi:hypothetical protein
VPVVKAIIDVTGRPFRSRSNGGTPVGYSGKAALWRKQCDMMLESWNSRAKGNGGCYSSVNTFPRQRTHTITKELLEAVFSMRFVPKLKEGSIRVVRE